MIRAGRYNLEYQYNEYERTITEEVEVSEKERKKLWIQTGCESDDGFYIEIPHIDKDALGMSRISMNSSDESRRSIDYLKNMQNYVSEERSMMGAYQNRLEHSYNNNNNIAENTTAAESLIRDIDMSKEMVQQSIHNILEQAGISMMSNSNQTNQGVLQLLR
jgi:flagellin